MELLLFSCYFISKKLYIFSIMKSFTYRFIPNRLIKLSIEHCFKAVTMKTQQNRPHLFDDMCCSCFLL